MLFFASAAGRSPHGEAGGNRLPGADIRPFLHRLNSGRVRSGSAITGKAQRGRTGQKACKESFHHVDFPSFFESGLSYRHIEYRTTVFRALSDFRKGLVKYQNTEQRPVCPRNGRSSEAYHLFQFEPDSTSSFQAVPMRIETVISFSIFSFSKKCVILIIGRKTYKPIGLGKERGRYEETREVSYDASQCLVIPRFGIIQLKALTAIWRPCASFLFAQFTILMG